jgi:hypothetical protein
VRREVSLALRSSHIMAAKCFLEGASVATLCSSSDDAESFVQIIRADLNERAARSQEVSDEGEPDAAEHTMCCDCAMCS